MDKRKNATKNKNGGLKSGRQKLKAKMLKSMMAMFSCYSTRKG